MRRRDLPIGCVDDSKDKEVLEQVVRVNDQGRVRDEIGDGLEWGVVGSGGSGKRRGDEKQREGNEMELTNGGCGCWIKKDDWSLESKSAICVKLARPLELG